MFQQLGCCLEIPDGPAIISTTFPAYLSMVNACSNGVLFQLFVCASRSVFISFKVDIKIEFVFQFIVSEAFSFKCSRPDEATPEKFQQHEMLSITNYYCIT